MADHAIPELIGRDRELGLALEQLALASDGPVAVVISGEAGIGKSSLWQSIVGEAAVLGSRVLATRPVEAELPLGYVGLGDVLGAAAEEVLPALPSAQRRALAAAMSLDAPLAQTDPLLVGRAVVEALRALASDGPIVVAVDDSQWLDPSSARAFAFAARRLDALPVAFVVTARAGHAETLDLAAALGARALTIELQGLDLGLIGRLVRSRTDPELSARLLRRIHARSAGNPFYALELARAGMDQLPASLDELVSRRLADLPQVATAAIEQVAVLGPAAAGDFADLAALDAAVASGVLVEDAGNVRFSHPLVAAGAYARIPPGRRRVLHVRAAAASGAIVDRAQHLALASTAPSEAVARTLDEAARVAAQRGAPETAAVLARHASRLTPPDDLASRASRDMDQADYLVRTADERAAAGLVEAVLSVGVRGPSRVRALVHRALTAIDAASAVGSLELAVAEPHSDVRLRARTLAQLAWQRGAWLGDLPPAVAEAREAVALAEQVGDEQTLASALTAAGLVTSMAGLAGAVDDFRRALEILRRSPAAPGDHTPRLAFAHERWWRGDFATAEELLAEEREIASEHGDEGLQLRLDVFGAAFEMRRGDWDAAERLLDRALASARDYWRHTALVRRAILSARRGDPGAASDIAELRAAAAAGGDALFAAAGDFAAGVIAAAEGRFAEAAELVLATLRYTEGNPARRAEFASLFPETIEILVAAGRPDDALTLIRALESNGAQLAPWGLAAAAYGRGLIRAAEGDTDDALVELEDARAEFERIGAPLELAGTLVAMGGARRRARQRRAAAEDLERAIEIYAALGAEPARARAEAELQRTRPRPRLDDRLTPTEGRVAELVVEGLTNREVAARLFTTVKTVEAHLGRIYGKLGVRSRTELARRAAGGMPPIERSEVGT
jgi:DNA-binding CsgD family transcriptional regulator